jgi:hypothetical protein
MHPFNSTQTIPFPRNRGPSLSRGLLGATVHQTGKTEKNMLQPPIAHNTLNRMSGAPVDVNRNSLTAGLRVPVLPQDYWLLKKTARFDWEPIPELTRQVLPTATGPMVLRPLGSLEEFLWLIDQNRPVHFALAAQVQGPTTVERWRDALDLVQLRHPLLSVRIETNGNSRPHFRRETAARIPLRVSIAFVIRDLLQALSGNPIDLLPVLPAHEEILGVIRSDGLQAEPSKESNSTPPARPATYQSRKPTLRHRIRRIEVAGSMGSIGFSEV